MADIERTLGERSRCPAQAHHIAAHEFEHRVRLKPASD
jgi:hypothetical protein